jgi:hypothetical protein
MATRTIQFHGQGYGATPVNATVTFDGAQIYNGPIPTVIGPYDPNAQELLFTTTISTDFDGTKPVTIVLNGGAMMFTTVFVNYVITVPNPAYSAEQYAVVISNTATRTDKLPIWQAVAVPALSSEDENILLTGTYEEMQPVLIAHNLEYNINNNADQFGGAFSSDSRTNVTINGVPQSAPPGNAGDFSWFVPTDGTISYTQNILAAPTTVM